MGLHQTESFRIAKEMLNNVKKQLKQSENIFAIYMELKKLNKNSL